MPRCRSTPQSFPELFRRQPCALGHRLELGPGDLWLDLMHRSRESREAAVSACYHTLAPDDLGVAHNTLGDQLRMLDEVGCRVEHPRDDHAVVRQADLAEHGPFVLVARVRALEGQRLWLRL